MVYTTPLPNSPGFLKMEANDKFDAIRCATELTLSLNKTGILDGCYGATGFKNVPLDSSQKGKREKFTKCVFHLYLVPLSLFSSISSYGKISRV